MMFFIPCGLLEGSTKFQLLVNILGHLLALHQSFFNGSPVVNTAVEAREAGLVGGLLEGRERTGRQAEGYVVLVGEGVVGAIDFGKGLGRRRRLRSVIGAVFGESGRGNERQPSGLAQRGPDVGNRP